MSQAKDQVNNAKGNVYYGMHFYPGVAEYQEPDREPYRVFLNEDTIRSMDSSFTGRPVYVHHVDEVEQNLDVLRGEVDGWVIESFYNAADGKHWVKFIIVSEKGERAIKQGMRLSNCYVPKKFGSQGVWNGVTYAKEVTAGEYEHLAIVPNPRYDESVILSPEKFNEYNKNKNSELELNRLANDKTYRKGSKMLQFFKRAKVENAGDLTDVMVVLPKSGKEVTISQLVNAADEATVKDSTWMGNPVGGDKSKNDEGYGSSGQPTLDPGGVASIKKALGNEGLADPAHKVKLHDGSYCNVEELVGKHKALHDELEKMKAEKGDKDESHDPASDGGGEDVDESGDPSHGDVDMSTADKMNEEKDDDAVAKKKALELAAHEDKEMKEEKKANAKAKADRLRNANNVVVETATVDLSEDRVARGKARYGSN